MSSSSSSSGVVSGRDIAPSAFDISIPGCDDPDKNDDLAYDLHHLVAVDSQPVDEDIKSVSTIERDQILFASARDNAQLLFNRIFALDKKDSDTGLLAVLPDIDTNDVGSIDAILPRFRPVPKVKAETRWEKFAKEKGIVNRKRDRMVFDEQSQTLKPRYGYGRANDDTKDWAIPVGANDDPYEDPFAKRDMEKKERVLKNQLKQMANVDRSLGLKTSHGLKSNLVGRNDKNARRKGGPSSDGAGGPAKKRARHGMGSDFTKEALVDAQRSDASMGRFGKLNSGERKADRGGRRRQYDSVTPSDASGERNMTQNVVDKLLGKQLSRVGRVVTRDMGRSEERDGGAGVGASIKYERKKGSGKKGTRGKKSLGGGKGKGGGGGGGKKGKK